MTIKTAQADLPRGLSGAADTWDQPQASVVLDDDYFEAAAPAGVTGTLDVTESGSDTFAATGGRAIVGTMSASEDVSDPATVLLLNFNGSNGSTTFTDSSQYAKGITASNGAQISTAQSKYGGAAGLFDGADDFLSSPNSNDFSFGSGDFSIEAWVYPTSTTGLGAIIGYANGFNQNSNYSFQLIRNGAVWQFDLISGETQYGGTFGSVTINQWSHVAFVRSGNNLYSFLNGTLVKTTNVTGISANNPGGSILEIGRVQGFYPWAGYIDDLRVKKGQAVYTANFTPPASQLTAYVPAQDGFSATGTVGGAAGITGTLAATESGSDTMAAAGTVQVQGALAVTESGSDTLASTGTVRVSGTLAASEAGSDTFSGTGAVRVAGSLAATEAGSDSFAAAGVVTVAGSLNATEGGADTLAATGTVLVQGAMAASEVGSDTFLANGSNQLVGSMAAQEVGSDTMAASGAVRVSGTMAASEAGADTMASTGTVIVQGSMAASEAGSDTLAATGTVTGGGPITGTMSAVEGGPDIFTAIGTIPGASPVNYYGSGKAKPAEPMDLVQLVREKWQAIEQARQRDAQRQPKAERQAKQAQPAPQISVEQAAMAPIASPFDDQTKAQRDAAAEEEQQIMAALALVMLDE